MRDFIWTGAVVPLVSERVVALLRDHEVTGWSTYEVNVFNANHQLIPSYYGFAVTGRCASIDFDHKKSALVYKANPAGRLFPYFKGLRFELGTWDGSDFFMGADEKTLVVVVTERVHRLFKKYKITNCYLEPIEEVELLATEEDVRKLVDM